MPSRLAVVAAAYPDRPATSCGGMTMTYADLVSKADEIAARLPKAERLGGECVATLFSRNDTALAAIFGALKMGHYVAPLNFFDPLPRQREIWEHAQASILLTDVAASEAAFSLGAKHVVVVDTDPSEVTQPLRVEDLPEIEPDGVALIIYTSGSTGAPRGVAHSHRSLLAAAVNRINLHQISPFDRVASRFRLSTMAAQLFVLPALLAGACLCLYDPEQPDCMNLARWVADEQITILGGTAASISATDWHDDVRPGVRPGDVRPYAHLRLYAAGGDIVAKNNAQRWFALNDSALFAANYASSETGTMCSNLFSAHSLPDHEILPAGYALSGIDVLILDEEGFPVAGEQVGEIAVRSAFLALGYWHDADSTAARFLPDPAGGDKRLYLTGDLGIQRGDGLIRHLGRKGQRVKIHGHSVEPAEVAGALLRIEGVEQAVVVSMEDVTGASHLVGYVVAAKAAGLTPAVIRRKLAESVPRYMVPSRVMLLEEFPATVIGKIDRRSLPLPDLSRRAVDGPIARPRSPLEEKLAVIWSEVLGVVLSRAVLLRPGRRLLSATQIGNRRCGPKFWSAAPR
ncbi:MAG: amino acid adenylation domain-containing protein [Caldilineaceae bacterium]|nr:amino acid adenylation domain-containing protein [Caldilineaceae bacterium]